MKKLKFITAMLCVFIGVASCTPEDLKDFLNNPSPTEEKDDEDNTTEEVAEPINPGLGLVANDLQPRPMQDIAKPGYLDTITDPSFGTSIRRITDAGNGKVIKPMYSTVQAWNADESLMIVYDQTNGVHQLLNGMSYAFIKDLVDIRPSDIEQIFWDFKEADILFYIDKNTADLVRYSIENNEKEILVNLRELTNCDGTIGSGSDVQMMSWDSDIIGFRCDSTTGYYYRISTSEVVPFNIADIENTAPMPAPSGERFYHRKTIYGTDGDPSLALNENNTEHSSLGRFADGSDGHFTVAFAEGPQGGCFGTIIAHDLVTGECYPVISEGLGYGYSKSGTHISAMAHKNNGWIAASMIGFEEDGQKLLDQELVLARVEKGNVEVYRIGHHRADENEFDYWGEPHAVISPTGTRVLFGSDWSGTEDGTSVDSYVVELPAFKAQFK